MSSSWKHLIVKSTVGLMVQSVASGCIPFRWSQSAETAAYVENQSSWNKQMYPGSLEAHMCKVQKYRLLTTYYIFIFCIFWKYLNDWCNCFGNPKFSNGWWCWCARVNTGTQTSLSTHSLHMLHLFWEASQRISRIIIWGCSSHNRSVGSPTTTKHQPTDS